MAENTLSKLKLLLLLSSLACLALLALAAFEENLKGDWRPYQRAYRERLLATAKDAAARKAAQRFDVSLSQYYLPELGRIDRCATCHAGIDNPAMSGEPQPLKAHPNGLLDHHPPDKFGCTVCHDGQGRAVQTAQAHGEVKHWEAPLLRGKAVYRSCGRCHYENDLYGASDDRYARKATRGPIDRAQIAAGLPGAAAAARGKQLVAEKGCLGCHKYRGRGGSLGPDITYAGDKSVHGYSFANVHGERSAYNWLYEHFKDPQAVSPGTLMPNLELTDEQARDLTEFMLGLRRKALPAAFTPVPPAHASEPADGKQLYAMFCSSCHGQDGKGSTMRVSKGHQLTDTPRPLLVPSINHSDTLAVASDDFLRHIITYGRPGTTMLAWGSAENGGLRPEEIDALVKHIRSWEPEGPDVTQISSARGQVESGRSIFAASCASCHGSQGEGAIGTRLNSPSFLAVASDEFLARTIVTGRSNTAMPSFKQLDSQQVSDLLAYLRTWHPTASDPAKALAEGTADIGKRLYAANCATCHGDDGKGDLGPSINSPEFLSLADDSFLYSAIVMGRPGTGMPSWRHFSSADVGSLVRFIRTWQKAPARQLSRATIHGDWDAGAFLYRGICAGCHGNDAEGGTGPQLNNPVLLSSASDSMLYEWIARGRTGTAMRPFAKGSQGPVELTTGQIENLVSYLRSLERKPRISMMRNPNGRPELGRQWYAVACAGCHGVEGQGASGPALSNREFLAAASDGFLLATMAAGRDGTPMRPVKKGAQSILSLSSEQLNDIVAFLRGWETSPPKLKIPHRDVIATDLDRGARIYAGSCAGCHGANGKPETSGFDAWAPALNNPSFLAAATDGFLQATIARGRPGTAMRPFGRGANGVNELTPEEIDDVVGFIRQWAEENEPETTSQSID